VSVLLEILGRGLAEDLRAILYPLYGGGAMSSVQALKSQLYEQGGPELELQIGLAHWREGQLDDARQWLATLCYRQGTARAALAAMAALSEERGNLREAAEYLDTLAGIAPDVAGVQFAQGLTAEQLDQPEQAAGHFARAIEIDEGHISAHKRLAAVQLRLGKPREALATYEALRAIAAGDTHLRTSTGCLQFHCGDYRDAAESFEVVIALEPENWAADNEAVTELVQRGQVREAIAVAEAMLEDQGPFADLHLQVANLYSLVGDDEPALSQYNEALSICPDYLEALIKLATHHLLFDRWEDSAEAFGRAALCSERLLVNYIGMGVSQAAANDIQVAARTLDLASAVDPNSTLLLTQMIRLHRRLAQAAAFGEPSAGMIVPGEPLERALEPELRCHMERVARQPLRPEGHFLLGVLLRSLGHPRQAASEFVRTARLHPTHVPALIKLGLVLKELEHDRLSARIFHSLFSVPGEQIEAHYRLAVTSTQHGQVDELARRMAARSEEKDLADIRADLALSLQHMGLMDRGASTWRALRETHRV
jgi:tetratricopeptide (TPR) repeat protein